MEINVITSKIIGAAIELHKKLGPDCWNLPMNMHWHTIYEKWVCAFINSTQCHLFYKDVKQDVGYKTEQLH
jgi:hypothetical protein